MFCTLKSGFPVCGRPLFGVRLVLDIGMTGREVSQPVQLVGRQQIHFLLGDINAVNDNFSGGDLL